MSAPTTGKMLEASCSGAVSKPIIGAWKTVIVYLRLAKHRRYGEADALRRLSSYVHTEDIDLSSYDYVEGGETCLEVFRKLSDSNVILNSSPSCLLELHGDPVNISFEVTARGQTWKITKLTVTAE